MNRLLVVGGVLLGVAIAFQRLRRDPRRRLGVVLRRRMEQFLQRLPEDAPPKLVMSILPRLREQNDQIIALLQEQNKLLRERSSASPGRIGSAV